MRLDLVENTLKIMERSFAEDEEFHAKIKELELKHGQLIKNEDRERFHLERADMYHQENEKNLLSTLKNMKYVQSAVKDVHEILVADTVKLQKAFTEVGSR